MEFITEWETGITNHESTLRYTRTLSFQKLSSRQLRPTLPLLHCLSNSLRSHWELEQSDPDSIINGIGKSTTHRNNCRFAAPLRIRILIIQDDSLNLGQPGKPRNFIGIKIEVENLSGPKNASALSRHIPFPW
jgi:hypothetical protein